MKRRKYFSFIEKAAKFKEEWGGPVALVAEDEADFAGVERLRMQPERLVGDDEDGVVGAPTERVHEAAQVAVDLGLAAA